MAAPLGFPSRPKELAVSTLQANKDHQYALRVYTERLESELATVDKLLNSADVVEDHDNEPELDVGGFIQVVGSSKATSPILSGDFLSPNSPFYDDAQKRTRYLDHITIHPMRGKELEVLAEAIRTENCRKLAFESQQRGQGGLVNSLTFDVDSNTEGLDWDRIAEKVSEVSAVPRSARECEIRWLGDRHPHINHNAWNEIELSLLDTILSRERNPDWVEIANRLGTKRTPIDCMRHGTNRQSHVWSSESEARLSEAVKMYGTLNWPLVARYVSENATAAQCQSKYSRLYEIKQGPWSEEENTRLRMAVEACGNSWVDVAVFIPGRSNEQCRERWTEVLHSTKGTWSDADDKKLLDVVQELGQNWRAVSDRMGFGRRDIHCRSRYEKLMKAKQPADAQPVAGPSTSSHYRTRSENSSSATQPPPKPRNAKSTTNVVAQPVSEPIQQVRPKPRPVARPSKGKGKAVEETEITTESVPNDVNDKGPLDENQTGSKRSTPPTAPDTEDAPAAKKRKTAEFRDGNDDSIPEENMTVDPGDSPESTTSPQRKRGRPPKPPSPETQDQTSIESAVPSNKPPLKPKGRPRKATRTPTPDTVNERHSETTRTPEPARNELATRIQPSRQAKKK